MQEIFNSDLLAHAGVKLGLAAAQTTDTPSRGSRHYRESLAKMAECVDLMNEQIPDFLIQLGDLTDITGVFLSSAPL